MDKHRNQYGTYGHHFAVRETKKRVKIKKGLFKIIFLFSIMIIFYFFINSSFFMIEEYSFVGLNSLKEEELLQVAELEKGDNIWDINLSRIEEQLAVLPKIEKIVVSRQLPNIVSFSILEKEKVAIIPYQSYYYEVAADGYLIGYKESYAGDYMMITGVNPLVVGLGGNIKEIDGGELIKEALRVLLNNPEIIISELYMLNSSNLALITIDGKEIWLGSDDIEVKISSLPHIVAGWNSLVLKGQDVNYADFRVLDSPVLVPAKRE